MRKALLAMVFLGLAANLGPAQADEASGPRQPYLGLAVEAVPPALSSHLPGILPKGQGILVAQVAKGSPAAKAGLKTQDILLSYGDHKLSSPEQLVKLVRGDKPGQEVALGFVRAGKSRTCKVMLGERESPNPPEKPRVFRFRPDEQLREIFEEFESKKGSPGWESLDGLKLTRLDANRWRAEIDYRSKEGKKEHKTFEGTREEIRKDIQAAKDLPANEQSHLLRALNLHEPVFEFHFPPFDKLGLDFWEQP